MKLYLSLMIGMRRVMVKSEMDWMARISRPITKELTAKLTGSDETGRAGISHSFAV